MNKEEIKQAIKKMMNVVRNGSPSEIKALAGPINKAPLHIKFVGGKVFSVNLHEVNSEFSICIDGLEIKPDWVDELGEEFITVPR